MSGMKVFVQHQTIMKWSANEAYSIINPVPRTYCSADLNVPERRPCCTVEQV